MHLYYNCITSSIFMRPLLTISLTPDIIASLKRRAKKAGITVSDYLRRILTHESNLITEEELLQRSHEAMRNYRAGKVKVLKSDEDIDRLFERL